MSEDAGVVTTLDVATQQLVETPVVPQSASGEPAQKPANSGTPSTPVDGGGEEVQPKGKNYYARKIDELTRREAEANRRADQALSMAQETLRRQQRESAPVQQPPTQPEKFVPHPQAPKQSDYETFEDFIRAETRFYTRLDAQQDAEKRNRDAQENYQKQQVTAQTAHVVNTYLDRVDNFKASTPDYEDVVSSLDEIPLTPRTASMTQAILLREDSGQILYHLGKNPSHAKHIATLPPALQAAAIGEIGARLSSAPLHTNAPAPAQPTRAGRASATDAYRDDMSVEEYLSWKKRRGMK